VVPSPRVCLVPPRIVFSTMVRKTYLEFYSAIQTKITYYKNVIGSGCTYDHKVAIGLLNPNLISVPTHALIWVRQKYH